MAGHFVKHPSVIHLLLEGGLPFDLGAQFDVATKFCNEFGLIIGVVDGAGLDHRIEVELPFQDELLVGVAPSIGHLYFVGFRQRGLETDRGEADCVRRFLVAAPAFALAWALPEGLACGACGDAPGCVEDEEKTPSPSACGGMLLPEALPPLLPSREPEATGPVGAGEPVAEAEGSLLVAGTAVRWVFSGPP